MIERTNRYASAAARLIDGRVWEIVVITKLDSQTRGARMTLLRCMCELERCPDGGECHRLRPAWTFSAEHRAKFCHRGAAAHADIVDTLDELLAVWPEPIATAR